MDVYPKLQAPVIFLVRSRMELFGWGIPRSTSHQLGAQERTPPPKVDLTDLSTPFLQPLRKSHPHPPTAFLSAKAEEGKSMCPTQNDDQADLIDKLLACQVFTSEYNAASQRFPAGSCLAGPVGPGQEVGRTSPCDSPCPPSSWFPGQGKSC